jgi:hypothetical protein
MLVNIKRSQYDGWLSTYYVLDATIEPTPDELELIEKHRVGPLVIFDSENVDYYADAAVQSAKSIGYEDHTGEPFFNYITSFYTSIYHLGAAAYNALQWSFSLRITVQSLIDGAHIESADVNEIYEAQNIITKAVDTLKAHLEGFQTFDGTEDLYER